MTHGTRIVSERGSWRGGGKGSMTASQLADFNATAGQLVGINGELFTPEVWKGAVPKHIHQPRILKALTPEERFVLKSVTEGMNGSLVHNVIDAVGIGMFSLGRLVPATTEAKEKARARRAEREAEVSDRRERSKNGRRRKASLF